MTGDQTGFSARLLDLHGDPLINTIEVEGLQIAYERAGEGPSRGALTQCQRKNSREKNCRFRATMA
jgi:hypothetical protein